MPGIDKGHLIPRANLIHKPHNRLQQGDFIQIGVKADGIAQLGKGIAIAGHICQRVLQGLQVFIGGIADDQRATFRLCPGR